MGSLILSHLLFTSHRGTTNIYLFLLTIKFLFRVLSFEGEISIEQSWIQEPNGAERTALISVPASVSGQKFPVVFDLHGNGGQGNLMRLSRWLGEDTIIVAPNGYERSWNVYNENSKAPDVEFIKLLIQKVGEDFPAAD